MRPDDPLPWQVLESKYLFRKPWLTMRQDRVRLPSGAVIEEYWVWEYSPWINVIALTASRHIVLVRQYRHALGQTHYELPGGVTDPTDTDLEQAARRELLEETGYGGGTWKPWMETSANPALQNNITHTFLATDVEPLQPPSLDAGEDLHVHLVPLDRLPELVLGGEFIQALHLAPLLRFLLLGVK